MAKKRARRRPVKIGVSRSGMAGAKLRPSGRYDFEPKEKDIARAARKGQSGKKGRPLPSTKVAVKGLDEERKARRRRAMRRAKSISTHAGGPDAGPGEGAG